MLYAYRRLWSAERGLQPGVIEGWLLLWGAVVVPLALAMSVYDPIITLVAIGALGAVVGLILFFNVRQFFIYALPVIFAISSHRVFLALIALLAVSFLADRLRVGRVSLQVPFPVLLSLLVLCGLNGVVRAVDADIGRYLFQYSLLMPLFIFLVIYNLELSTRDIRNFLLAVCLVAALVGWVSLGLYIQTGIPRRVFAWPSQNQAACLFGVILPYALVSLIDARQVEQRILWGWILLGLGVGLLVTQTRAVLISSLIAVLYISWKDRRAMRIMLPALLVALVAAPTLIVTRMALLFGKGAEIDWSSIGRVQIWLNSLEFIPRYFLFGMGLDSFRTIYPTIFPYSIIRAEHPHDVYLRWLFELGLVGLVAYVLFILGCLRRGHRTVARVVGDQWGESSRIMLGLNAGIINVLVAGLVDSYLSDPRVLTLFWSMLCFQLLLARRTIVADAQSG